MSLPSTYRELEYLESTGTQYIDVGIKGNLETSFIAKVNKTVRSTNNALAFFGDNTTSSSAISLNLSVSDNKTIRFDGKTISNSAWVSLNTDYVVEIDKTGVVIDNVTKGTFTSPSSFTTTNNLYLFTVNGLASDFIDGTTRIYWAKVYDNNVQVRHYIPVQRISDNVLGLYDLENDIFYTNAGTGTFIAGPVLVKNINKVIYNNAVLIDLTGDTVTASDVAQGKVFHLADGTQTIGAASSGPTRTLLWTNSNLSADFNEQSININVSSYDYIQILATMNSTGTYSYIFKVSEISSTKYNDGTGIPQTFGYVAQTSSTSTAYNNSRAIYNASNLSFTSCYERSGTSNNHCKPYQVYGISGLSF